jgi:hypothetical protein
VHLPGAVLGAVGVPADGVQVGAEQPQPVGHELLQRHRRRALRQPDPGVAGLLGDPDALLQHGVGEAHDPLDRRPGGMRDLLGRLAGADAGLDHAGRQRVAQVDVDLGDPVGVAARGGPETVVDRHEEPVSRVRGVRPVRGEHQVLAVVGESHEAQGAHEGGLQAGSGASGERTSHARLSAQHQPHPQTRPARRVGSTAAVPLHRPQVTARSRGAHLGRKWPFPP